MDFILKILIPYLLLYKYLTIFFISFVAAFMLPVPSGSMLMATGAFTSFGYFNMWFVIILSIIGNVLGDNLGYLFSRKYGRKILYSIGFRKILESKNFRNIEQLFRKKPGFIIFMSRFEVLSTLSVNLLSGISKTPYRKYLYHEFLGTIAQVSVYTMIGYFFASSWQLVGSTFGKLFLLLIFMIILFIIKKSKKVIINKIG